MQERVQRPAPCLALPQRLRAGLKPDLGTPGAQPVQARAQRPVPCLALPQRVQAGLKPDLETPGAQPVQVQIAAWRHQAYALVLVRARVFRLYE